MKDWTSWGTKIREFSYYNYKAIWGNLKTIRVGTGVARELPPNMAEFYDVGVNTVCNAECTSVTYQQDMEELIIPTYVKPGKNGWICMVLSLKMRLHILTNRSK